MNTSYHGNAFRITYLCYGEPPDYLLGFGYMGFQLTYYVTLSFYRSSGSVQSVDLSEFSGSHTACFGDYLFIGNFCTYGLLSVRFRL